MKAIIIGCGGVGSWLAHSMAKLIEPKNILLVDGDTLEEKNLDRQLFSMEDIGRNKAEALADLLKCDCVPSWYSMTTMRHEPMDYLFGCVDNHPARNSILRACDFNECCAILGANETLSAEAYFYNPDWQGTPLDPRVYYPEIVKVTDNDPRNGAVNVNCTGEEQEKNRQLVTANFMAAALMQHLFVAYAIEGPQLDENGRKHLPCRLSTTLSRMTLTKIMEQQNGTERSNNTTSDADSGANSGGTSAGNSQGNQND